MGKKVREFDVIIEQKVVLQSIEEYETHISDMELAKENIENVMMELRNQCKGQAINESYSAMMKLFVDSHFAKAYENIKKMKTLLEDTLPRINNSLVRCSEFHLQLCCDSYMEPDKPAVGDNRIRNGGILAINYNKVSILMDTCVAIKETGKKINNEIQNLIYSVSNDVPGIEIYYSELADAYKYLKRIENLRVSLLLYKNEVVALEGILQEGLAAIELCEPAMTPYAEKTDSYGIAEDELVNRVLEIECSRLNKILDETRLDDLRKATRNEHDLEMLDNIVAGNYKSAFEIPPAILSDEMKAAVAKYSIDLIDACDYEVGEGEELSGIARAAREEINSLVEQLVENGNGGRTEDYLDYFVQSTSTAATTVTTFIAETGYCSENQEQYMNALKDAMNVWLTVSTGVNLFSESSQAYNWNEFSLGVEQFGYYEGEFVCRLVSIPETEEYGPGNTIEVKGAFDGGCTYPENIINSDLVSKQNELDAEYNRLLINLTIDSLGGEYIDPIKAVMFGDVKGASEHAVEKGTEGAVEKFTEWDPEVASVIPGVIDDVVKIIDLEKEVTKLKNRQKAKYFLSTFVINAYQYKGDYSELTENKDLISTQYCYKMIDPSIAKKAMEWSNYGFIAVLEDDSATPVELLDKADQFYIESKLKVDNLEGDLRNVALYMIFGNSIYGTDVNGKTIAEKIEYTGNYKSIYEIPAEYMEKATTALDSDYLKTTYTTLNETTTITIYELWESQFNVVLE